MSGSPALVFRDPTYEFKKEKTFTIGGKENWVLGIFSKMRVINTEKPDETSMELGYIWKGNLILEIIDSFDEEKYEKNITSFITPLSLR